MMRTLRPLEWVLASFSVFIICFSAYWLSGERNLYPKILGLKSDTGLGEVIGRIKEKQGELKKQSSESTFFKSTVQNEALNNDDILITGSESSGVLQLNDGGTIELGPNSMVKLSVENNLGLGGVARSASVEIISGAVKIAPKKAKSS